MNLTEAFKLLDTLYESYPSEINRPIDLSKCKQIVPDVNNEDNKIEASACVDYYPQGSDTPVLSRVAAYVMVIRKTADGYMFLAKRKKHRLPGGGYDIDKDKGDLANTVVRETFEETGIKIKNVQDANYSIWRFEQDNNFEAGWVLRHISDEASRHHGYYEKYYIAEFDYDTNSGGEEASIFDWYPISSAAKSVSVNKILYDAAEKAGYLSLNEDMPLTEEKQVGLVSYCVHRADDSTPSIVVLDNILKKNFIKASEPDKSTWPFNKPYVSLSRNLTSHIGPTWKNGVVLDGTKLSNKYSISSIDHNSLIFYNDSLSAKKLELRGIAKLQNTADPSKVFYIAWMHGNSFKVQISEATYNALKYLMNLYNVEPAVQASVGSTSKRGAEKYRGRTVADVKRFSDKAKQFYNTAKQSYRKATVSTIPANLVSDDGKWKYIEGYLYDVAHSGLFLTHRFLSKYKDELLVNGYNIDSKSFLYRVAGHNYADEAEERVLAKTKEFIDKNGQENTTTKSMDGIDITGCIKGIMINRTYEYIIKNNFSGTPYLCDSITGKKTARIETNKATLAALQNIVEYSESNNIPIIFAYEGIQNVKVLSQLN